MLGDLLNRYGRWNRRERKGFQRLARETTVTQPWLVVDRSREPAHGAGIVVTVVDGELTTAEQPLPHATVIASDK